MDSKKFDDLARRLGSGVSRRQVLRGFFGGAGAVAIGAIVQRGASAAGNGESCTDTSDCDNDLICIDDVCGCPEPSRYCEDTASCFSPSTGGCCRDAQCGTGVCVNNVCCTPDCDGKSCGEDGCGGVCGVCGGQNEQCVDGTCQCIADCAGKTCGDDGCGGSCGECIANDNSYCDQATGNCACDPYTCDDIQPDGHVVGATCGGSFQNGCGGTIACYCGPAENPLGCCGGTCYDFTTDEAHCGSCNACPTGDVCYESECCTPLTCDDLSSTDDDDIAGGECGIVSDGCGGTIDCTDVCEQYPNSYCDVDSGECDCAPFTCDDIQPDGHVAGATCGGSIDDGCGNTLACWCGPAEDPLGCCGGTCYDFTSDPEHCGACVTTCDEGEICVAKECVPDPCPGKVQCEGANANCCDSLDQCAPNGDCCASDRIICGDSCCPGPCDSCVDGQCVSDVTGGICFDPANNYATGVCCSGTCESDGTVICEGENGNCCPSDSQCAGNGDCCATDRVPCDFGCCGPCQTCGDGVCVGDLALNETTCFDPDSDPQYQQGICCNGECDSSGATTCPVCTPDCEGKYCGDDGCGGVCGLCEGEGEVCEDGMCVPYCVELGEFCGVLDVQVSGGYVDPCCEGTFCYDDYCVECIPDKGWCEWDEDCCGDDAVCWDGYCMTCHHEHEACEWDEDCCDGLSCCDGWCKTPKKECGHKGDYCKEDWDCCYGYRCKDGACHKKHHKPQKPDNGGGTDSVNTLPSTGVNDGDGQNTGIGAALAGGAAALLAAKLLRNNDEEKESSTS